MTPRVTADYHMHSLHSGDGHEPVSAFCEAAVERGLSAIGFCEHLDFEETDLCYGVFDYDAYSRAIDEARAAFAGRLLIHKGVEFSYEPHHEGVIGRYLASHEFDYSVISIHFLGHAFIDGEYCVWRGAEALWAEYFEAVRLSAESGLGDLVGHIGLPARYWGATWASLAGASYREGAESALRAAAAAGRVIECNTSSLRTGLPDPMPTPGLLAMFAELGGRVVALGSDAHYAADVGASLSSVAETAVRCGLSLWAGPGGLS